MKKRGKDKFLKIKLFAIIILIVINISLAGILIKDRKVIEKDKGVLYNLGKIFSFKWLVGLPIQCPVPSSVLSCEGTKIVEKTDILDCPDCHVVTTTKKYLTNCFPYNCKEGACLNSCSSDSDCGEYSFVTCAVGYDYIRQANIKTSYCDLNPTMTTMDSTTGMPTTTSNPNYQKCIEKELFTSPWSCTDGYKCVESNDPNNLNPEIGNAKCGICGDEMINSDETCDLGKFCIGDPRPFEIDPNLPEDDPLKYGKKRCKTSLDCIEFACSGDCSDGNIACETMDVFACEKQTTGLNSASPFSAQADPPLVPVIRCITCTKTCGCQTNNPYTEEERKCFDFTDEKGNKRKGIQITSTPFIRKINADNGECEWFAQTPVEKTINCSVCQSCGNYLLLGGNVLTLNSNSVGIPQVIGSISITNDDSIDHAMIIKGSGDLSIDWGVPSGSIIKAKETKNILIKVLINQVFCGNKYGKIMIKFAGKYYVYDIAVFMKSNCRCGETPKKPPIECLDYVTIIGFGGLPSDTSGLKTKITDPNNPKDVKVCRWGKEVPFCDALEIPTDLIFAGLGFSAGIQIPVNEIKQREYLRKLCLCREDIKAKGVTTINIVDDNDPALGGKPVVIIAGPGLNILYISRSAMNLDACPVIPTPAPLPTPPQSSGGAGGSSSSYASSVTISSAQLASASGVTKTFIPGQTVTINLPGAEEPHEIEVTTIDETSAKIIISSTQQKKTLSVGEEWKVDVNSDGTYDLLVKLDRIQNNQPVVSMRAINETIVQAETVETPAEIEETPQPTVQESPKFDKTLVISALIVMIVCIVLLIWKLWKRKLKRR